MPVTIDGTNGVSKVAAGGVNQAAIAAGVAGTGPAFRASRPGGAGNTGVSNATRTRIALPTEDFDLGGRFNNTAATVNGIPPYAFMPDVAGYYAVNGSLYAAATGTTLFVVQVRKNDTAILEGSYCTSPNAGVTNVAGIVYMNGTTDYLDLWAYVAGTGGQTINGDSAATFMSAHLVRAA